MTTPQGLDASFLGQHLTQWQGLGIVNDQYIAGLQMGTKGVSIDSIDVLEQLSVGCGEVSSRSPIAVYQVVDTFR